MIYDIFIKVYSILYSDNNYVNKMLSPIRHIVRTVIWRILPSVVRKMEMPQSSLQRDEKKVIVSLTSFPARINVVWQVVKCMMCQSYRPDKIILWLSLEQFPTMQHIPENLVQLQGDIFEIRLVSGDLKSHKKHFYAFQKYPNDLVFIIDDDLYYQSNLLERVIAAHKKYPNSIICNYGFEMQYDMDGRLLPYNRWRHSYKENGGKNFFFGSGGGTLFQPSLLYKDIADSSLFLQLTPQADDIWLNAMVKLANMPIYKLKSGLIVPIYIRYDVKLASRNLYDGGNDESIRNITMYYMEKIGRNPFRTEDL